ARKLSGSGPEPRGPLRHGIRAGAAPARRGGPVGFVMLPLLALVMFGIAAHADAAPVTVGSKAFPESWVLAEALAQAMRSEGVPEVEHRNNLGGTEIVYQ